VTLADRDQAMTHPDFRRKLEAIGFGFFIPVFFVSSGVRFDLGALTASDRSSSPPPRSARSSASSTRPRAPP
jgi:hypothetical protein